MMGISIKGQRIGQADVIDIDIVECGLPRHIGIVRVGNEKRQWVDGYKPIYDHDVTCEWGDDYVDVTVSLRGAVNAIEAKHVALR